MCRRMGGEKEYQMITCNYACHMTIQVILFDTSTVVLMCAHV